MHVWKVGMMHGPSASVGSVYGEGNVSRQRNTGLNQREERHLLTSGRKRRLDTRWEPSASLESRVVRLCAGRTQFCHARHWTSLDRNGSEAGRRAVRPIVMVTHPNPRSGGCAPPPLASRIQLGSRAHLGECFERTWNSLECLVGRQCLPSPLRQDVENSS